MPSDISELASWLSNNEHDVAYAALDGAGIPNLVDKLFDQSGLEYQCLFGGELAPDMAEVAPYLARLDIESEFLDWTFSGWGEAWGIYLVVPSELDTSAVRRHLRTLNMVMGPDHQPLYFRWYDPRVLRNFLPTCSAQQLREFFGPVQRFIAESEKPEQGIVFSLANGRLSQQRFTFKS